MPKTTAELTVVCDGLSERIDALRQDLSDLRAENKALAEQLRAEQVASARSREEATQTRRDLDRAHAKIDGLVTELATARQETAVVRQQHLDHVANYQEWDRRKWGLITILVGAVMSLTSGLIVAFMKK